jgi:hypothetical protein
MPTIGSKSACECAGELSLSEANANPVIITPIACASDWGDDDRVRSLQSHLTALISADRLHQRACERNQLSFTLPFRARHLPGGGVEAVEEVGRGDHEDQGCEPLLVVVPGGLVPDRVWDRVRPIG